MSDMTANLSVTVKHNKGHNTSYLSNLWRDFQVMSQSFVKATARSTYTDDVLVWLRSNLKKLVSLTFPFTVCIVASYYSYTSRQNSEIDELKKLVFKLSAKIVSPEAQPPLVLNDHNLCW